MKTTETPIETSIHELEKYLALAQNANLAEILMVGEKRKKEGEVMKQKWWEWGKTWDEYRARRGAYDTLCTKREKKQHKHLEKIGYFGRNGMPKKKFLHEFAQTAILYDDKLVAWSSEKTEIKWLDAVLTHLREWPKEWVTLKLRDNNLWPDWAKYLAEALEKTWWLRAWVMLDLYNNNLWPDWAKYLAEALEKTWWLKEWVTLKLRSNNLWPDWAKYLAEALEKTWWLRAWVTLELRSNNLWPDWAKYLAEALEKSWWLKAWVTLNLWWNWNNLWPDWVKYLAEAIEKTGWYPKWARVNL